MSEVSVVVCSYGRTTDLFECLKSLEAQDYPRNKRETIVVTNSDDINTINLVHSDFPSITLAATERKGLSFARNKGIELAQSPIVAFIDDDALASVSWLSNIVRAYSSDQTIAGVGGKVLPFTRFKIPAPFVKYADYLSLFDKGDLRRPVKEIFGCNMSFRRGILLRLNGFDETLGRLPGTLLSGEETELCARIRALNLQIIYEPGAVVHHRVGEERLTWSFILRRAYWGGMSDERWRASASRLRLVGNLFGSLLTAPRRYPLDTAVHLADVAGRLRESFRRDAPLRNRLQDSSSMPRSRILLTSLITKLSQSRSLSLILPQ